MTLLFFAGKAAPALTDMFGEAVAMYTVEVDLRGVALCLSLVLGAFSAVGMKYRE